MSARGRLDLGACLRGQPVGPAALRKPAITGLLGALPSGNRGKAIGVFLVHLWAVRSLTKSAPGKLIADP